MKNLLNNLKSSSNFALDLKQTICNKQTENNRKYHIEKIITKHEYNYMEDTLEELKAIVDNYINNGVIDPFKENKK